MERQWMLHAQGLRPFFPIAARHSPGCVDGNLPEDTDAGRSNCEMRGPSEFSEFTRRVLEGLVFSLGVACSFHFVASGTHRGELPHATNCSACPAIAIGEC